MKLLIQSKFEEPQKEEPKDLGGEPLVIHQREDPTKSKHLIVFFMA
jgi:hypothetical protein